MKASFIYDFNENDRVEVSVENLVHINKDLNTVKYSGTLTGEIIEIEDNIDYNGMSGIYIGYEEDISLEPKMIYLHYTEITSIKKI